MPPTATRDLLALSDRELGQYFVENHLGRAPPTHLPPDAFLRTGDPDAIMWQEARNAAIRGDLIACGVAFRTFLAQVLGAVAIAKAQEERRGKSAGGQARQHQRAERYRPLKDVVTEVARTEPEIRRRDFVRRLHKLRPDMIEPKLTATVHIVWRTGDDQRTTALRVAWRWYRGALRSHTGALLQKKCG